MYPLEHIGTMLKHKILQTHLLHVFVANLKIGAIYALYPESFCDKNLAFRKVFAFSDSGFSASGPKFGNFESRALPQGSTLNFGPRSTKLGGTIRPPSSLRLFVPELRLFS